MENFSLLTRRIAIFFIMSTIATTYAVANDLENSRRRALMDSFWILSGKGTCSRHDIDKSISLGNGLTLFHLKEPNLEQPTRRFYTTEEVVRLPRTYKGIESSLNQAGTLYYTMPPQGAVSWKDVPLWGFEGTDRKPHKLDNDLINSIVLKDALGIDALGLPSHEPIAPTHQPQTPVSTPGPKSTRKVPTIWEAKEGIDKLDLQGLYPHRITDETIKGIFKEPKDFTYVTLYNAEITDAGLETILRGSPNLYSLWVTECNQITDNGIAFIKQYCPSLKELHLGWCGQITDKCIKGLPELTDLTLDKCSQITDEALGDLPESIVILYLHRSGFTDEGIKKLSRCPKLDLLSLFDCSGIDDQALESLPSNINRLWLNACTNTTGENVERFNPVLTRLELKDSNFTEQGIQNLLTKCSRLKFLEIDSANITDQNIFAISKLSNLEILDLHQLSNITKESITAISKLSNLGSLYLYDLPTISSGDLAPLLNLEHLKYLQLYNHTIVKGHEEIRGYLQKLIATPGHTSKE